jgi:hypothetical protein
VPRIWGLTAVEDQNVGGAMMMLEQSVVLLIAFVVLFVPDAYAVRGRGAAQGAPRAGGACLSALLEGLGVELPVVQAGMGGGISRAALAGAVSGAAASEPSESRLRTGCARRSPPPAS